MRIATYRAKGIGGPHAPLEGVLSLKDGCLIVEVSQDYHVLPVFPDNRAYLDHQKGLLVLTDMPGELEYGIGAEVGFAGMLYYDYGDLNLNSCEGAAADVFVINGW